MIMEYFNQEEQDKVEDAFIEYDQTIVHEIYKQAVEKYEFSHHPA